MKASDIPDRAANDFLRQQRPPYARRRGQQPARTDAANAGLHQSVFRSSSGNPSIHLFLARRAIKTGNSSHIYRQLAHLPSISAISGPLCADPPRGHGRPCRGVSRNLCQTQILILKVTFMIKCKISLLNITFGIDLQKSENSSKYKRNII